jgi:PilZ domain
LRFEEISDGRWAASAGGHSLIVVGWFERSKELPTFAENKIAKGSHPGTSQPVKDAPPAFLKVPAEKNFCSIGSVRIELVPLPCLMTSEIHCGTRRHQRICLPQGMSVTWYGGGQQQVSRVKTLSMGGLFLCGSITLRVGTDLTLVFEVPGGMVLAEAVVRNIVPGEGMGIEFTKMNPETRVLLERLLTRLLR